MERQSFSNMMPNSYCFPGSSVVKNPPATAGDAGDRGLIPGSGRSPGGGNGTPVFLPGESHGQRSLTDYSPQGHKELDMTEQLNMHARPSHGYQYKVSSSSTQTHAIPHPVRWKGLKGTE